MAGVRPGAWKWLKQLAKTMGDNQEAPEYRKIDNDSAVHIPSVIANAKDFDDSGGGQQEYEGVCAELRSQNSPPSSTELLLLGCDLGQAHQTSTGLPFYIHKMGIILPHYVLP